jgi:hypothetical protein
MSKENRTPPPWTTEPDNEVDLRNGTARIVWSDLSGYDVAYVLPLDGDKGNSNARLIAAAPDLLGALLKMTERFSPLVALLEIEDDDPDHMEDHKAIADAQAAIAKATGK